VPKVLPSPISLPACGIVGLLISRRSNLSLKDLAVYISVRATIDRSNMYESLGTVKQKSGCRFDVRPFGTSSVGEIGLASLVGSLCGFPVRLPLNSMY